VSGLAPACRQGSDMPAGESLESDRICVLAPARSKSKNPLTPVTPDPYYFALTSVTTSSPLSRVSIRMVTCCPRRNALSWSLGSTRNVWGP